MYKIEHWLVLARKTRDDLEAKYNWMVTMDHTRDLSLTLVSQQIYLSLKIATNSIIKKRNAYGTF